MTARDLQKRDGQWTRAKGFDTFCPLGPWIETELDPSDLRDHDHGRTARSARTARTADCCTASPTLIAYVSRVMTLLPGDVILTGTPAGVGPIRWATRSP